MRFKIVKKIPEKASILIVPFFEERADYQYITQLTGIGPTPDFSGKLAELLIVYHPTKNLKIFLLGLGKEEHLNRSANTFRSLAFKQHSKWTKAITLDLAHLPAAIAFQAMQGLRLAGYSVGVFKTTKEASKGFSPEKTKISIVHSDKSVGNFANEGILTAETQIEMMKLVDSPGNQKTPDFIAKYVVNSGKKYGYKVKVLKKNALEKEGLDALLAVGQGSINEPVLIQLEYKPNKSSSKRPKLGLVGKGITFDTGGLSIKAARNMHYMKSDMGGAAAVIGAIELAAKLKLDIHIVGIIPSAENSVDAKSVRPGDVISSFSGKTIEIIDTDAEGRLVLADGLSYIEKKHHPETIIDLATLTGSCVLTFGYTAGGLFTQNETLAVKLMEIGQKTRERLWQLPLWEDYDSEISSDIADVRNFSGKPVAGAITAAKFLEYFIKDHPKWAHLDIAGVAFGDSEFTKMKSATGFGIRLLVEFMKEME